VIRAGLVPVFVDVEADTYNIDPAGIAEAITSQTGAILGANLIGNVPDWDEIRTTAKAHGLMVIEDSCDALGPTLRGTPTGERADMTVTSFASSHIITCAGSGGMLMFDDPELRDKAVLLRRWGRRSELHFFGSKRHDHTYWEDLDGIPYDNQFIFDELGWNFEPSEIGAAFGLVQLDKLEENREGRQRNFHLYTEFFGLHEDRFVLPRQLPETDTAWLCYPLTIRNGAGFERSDLQSFLESKEIDTRTVWTGNATRQPMLRGRAWRMPRDGLPHADEIMRAGFVLPCNHGMGDAHISYVTDCFEEFLASR
jgi:CDP-4-dehydro-6-deoxyglucose reductase, E1